MEELRIYKAPERDMLKVKQAEWLGFDDEELAFRRAARGSNAGISDLRGLQRRIAEFVHVSSLDSTAVRKAQVNSLFIRSAKRFDTTPMQVMHDLVGSGYVSIIERGGNEVLYSTAVLNAQVERVRETAAGYGLTPEQAVGHLYDRLVSNVFEPGLISF